MKRNVEREITKAERRVARMSTQELPGWAESALVDTGRSLGAWRNHGEAVNLEDAIVGAEALSAILRELQRRTG